MYSKEEMLRKYEAFEKENEVELAKRFEVVTLGKGNYGRVSKECYLPYVAL